MIIQHNIPAMSAQRNLGKNQNAISGNLEKLSTGYRINRSADDAAGVAVSEKMRCQVTGLGAAMSNVRDGQGLIQIGDGGMSEIHDILNRLEELSVLSANGTFDDDVDRDALQQEVDELLDEIDRISESTNFNGIYMLNQDSDSSNKSSTNGVSRPLDVSASPITNVGNFTVTGGVEGVDYSYDSASGVLSILSSTDMRIEGGSGSESIKVSDSAGTANIALCNVTINSTTGNAFATGNNDVNLVLEGVNTLSTTASGKAGVNVGEFGSIAISGTGILTANCDTGVGAAGIGSDAYGSCGDITINGGIINCNGGYNGTAIGAGDYATCGIITINGGTVTAIGGSANSAIGGGMDSYTEAIIINGGTITATGGKEGAGIGTGYRGEVEAMLISPNANITATGGLYAEDIGDGQFGVTNLMDLDYDGSPWYSTARGDGIILQIGDTNDDWNILWVPTFDMGTANLGLDPFLVDTLANAQYAMGQIWDAVNYVSECRAEYGAYDNRLEHTYQNLSNMRENIQAAESAIRDTDMAEEMMDFTKNSILSETSQSMVAHSNQQTEHVMSLFVF